MSRWWTLVILPCAVVALAHADSKFGKQVRFAGVHPIPKSEGGGICYIEGPHVHIYAADKLEYREHGPDHVFVGDPVAYGFDGPRFAYNGPHPIQVDAVVGGPPAVEYCYLRGPHFHNFAPPDGPEFEKHGDAYFYVAEPPRAFIDARPQFIGINDRYRPLVYDRPRIEVEPPHGWIGVRPEFAGPGVVVEGPRAGLFVDGPHGDVGVDVHIPLPSVHVGVPGVEVRGPGVIVGGPRVDLRGPRVDIRGPGIVLGGPGVVVHDRPVIIEEHGHHDNGRHEGWHKH